VFFKVVEAQTGEINAVIAYGRESKEFYNRWLGYDDPAVIKELQGPTLNTQSYQSQSASALLKQVEFILGDDQYVERLKRHYKMYKAAIDPRVREQVGSLTKKKTTKRVRHRRKIDGN
jgi:hypothetical protein